MITDAKGRDAIQLIPFGPQHSLGVAVADLMKKEISSADEMEFFLRYFVELMSLEGFSVDYSALFISMTTGYKTIFGRGSEAGMIDHVGVVEPERFNCLTENIVQLKKHYGLPQNSEKLEDTVLQKIEGLFEFISLECLRLGFEAQHARNLTVQVESATRSLNAAINKASNVDRRMNRSQKEYIAILGIFAAVVVAFSGGVNFTLSGLSALQGYNVVYIAFIVSIIGGFMFNILYALFTFVYRAIRQNGDNWGILGKDAFIKINQVIIFVVAFFFFVAMLMTFVEHSWSLQIPQGSPRT